MTEKGSKELQIYYDFPKKASHKSGTLIVSLQKRRKILCMKNDYNGVRFLKTLFQDTMSHQSNQNGGKLRSTEPDGSQTFGPVTILTHAEKKYLRLLLCIGVLHTIMANEQLNISIEVTEINRPNSVNGTNPSELDIDALICADIVQLHPRQSMPAVQQAVNPRLPILRQIPDQRSTPVNASFLALVTHHGDYGTVATRNSLGCLWLGECAICRDRDNEGFLHGNQNEAATCGHPLCQNCANIILQDSRRCPKCRQTVNLFRLVRFP
ncbi:hypothetical protein I4U23_027621 [Adineta vaga]|nr:hypothetical protein I4U23_027621 [Adineta vaga]